MREGFFREVNAFDQRRQEVAGIRAVDGDDRPLLGGGGQPDLVFGELGLEVVFHHVEDAGSAASRGGDVETVCRQAADDAVIADEAVFAEQHAIAGAAGLQLAPGVGVHAIEEFGGVGAYNLDLAQRRSVENAQRVTRRLAFAGHRGMHVLARLGEVPGTAPQRDRLEDGALFLGPAVDGRLTRDVEQAAAIVACKGAEGGRRVRRPEGGEANLRRRLLHGIGRDDQAVDVGRLALVGRHAIGGVALDVFDGAEAFAHGQTDILGGDVVLEIDEGLGGGGVPVGRQLTARRAGEGDLAGDGIGGCSAGKARIGCRGETGRRAFGERRGKAEVTIARTGAAALFDMLGRQEDLAILAPFELALGMREQVQAGVPATAHQQSVAGEFARLARAAIDWLGANRGDAQAALGAGHGPPGQHLDAQTGCRGL